VETGLAGKRVLVTGGSGGIGAACVRLFATDGAEVIVHYHRGLERAQAAGGSSVAAADLTDEADVERLFDEVGPLAALVEMDDHLGAFGGEETHTGRPDAARASGDEYPLAYQSGLHEDVTLA